MRDKVKEANRILNNCLEKEEGLFRKIHDREEAIRLLISLSERIMTEEQYSEFRCEAFEDIRKYWDKIRDII